MRVLLLSWEYPPHLVGGLGAHVAELVPALADQGVALTVVTPRWRGGAPKERLAEHAVVYRIEPPVEEMGNYFADVQQTNINLATAAHALWQNTGGFDLIHAHDWLVGFAARSLKNMHKTPLLVTIHATERGRGRGELRGELAQAINGAEWWLTFEAWRVIATSRFMANEVRDYFHLPSDKISVIANGVNPARFAPYEWQDLGSFRRGWASPDERLVYYVGRVQEEKGVYWLVEAAQRLVQRGELVKFVIAGTGADLEPLRRRVTDLGLTDRVLLPGYVSNQLRDHLYKVADVAVFPSLYEPFGIVALEAMAAKCPVIVSDVGGLGEVVDDDLTGIKIPPANLDALVNAISRTLVEREAARARAERAFQVVCRIYSWPHIARETIELYDHIIRARAACHWD